MLYCEIMDRNIFDQLVTNALDALPDEISGWMENVEVVVADWPTPTELAAVNVRSRYHLLGLYQGIPLTRRGSRYGSVAPDKITLFQKPIEHVCKSDEEIEQRVQDVLVHEVAHHFGIGEVRLRELEALRDQKRRQGGK